jgi:hypothetical protein
MTVEVVGPPALVRVPNVELVQAGTWSLSTGLTTFTSADLYSAVAALDCPAVHRPILKLGHDGNHGQGEAALGYIDNMAVADNGLSLVGDYAGMPAWLADQNEDGSSVLASALPQRSIEGEFDFRCGLGHTHPFVVLAVALLGVSAPGVSTIASLQDIATAYGVEVAAAALPEPTGTRVVVAASAQEAPMPNPRPTQITATVTSTDVSRAFYNSPLGQSWDHWIVEIQLDPLAVIYENDEDGSYYYVPVTLGSGDGTDAVEFGEPEERVMQFAPKQAAASSGRSPIRFASRDESRPGPNPKTPAASASGDHNPGEEPPVVFTDEQLTTLRQQLGLPEDADAATILAANAEALAERAESTDPVPPAPTPTPPNPPTPPTPQAIPEGLTVIETDVLEGLQTAAAAGQSAHQRFQREDRDREIDAAVRAGKITPARVEHWQKAWEADPEGAKATLASLAPGLVPVEFSGSPGEPDNSDHAVGDALIASLGLGDPAKVS